MGKIIFLLNNVAHPRCHKRIGEFIENGYDVSVYGFARKGCDIQPSEHAYTTTVLTDLDDGYYLLRLKSLFHHVRKVLSQVEEGDMLYLFGLDIAMAVFFQFKKRPYIYEESDLVHTYVKNRPFKHLLEFIDVRIIKRSHLTVFTSEGFVRYHFHHTTPENVCVIPNRLAPSVLQLPPRANHPLNVEHLHLGFVGAIRFQSVFDFAKNIGERYPQHTFHFFGACDKGVESQFARLKEYPNIVFHGPFTNPIDLPEIYAQIDFVVSTYDIVYDNVRYAEPNKLYEAIYFETPIIVSQKTYLEEKVRKMNIGFVVDAHSPCSIDNFMGGINEERYTHTLQNIRKISKQSVVNVNHDFFDTLAKVMHEFYKKVGI